MWLRTLNMPQVTMSTPMTTIVSMTTNQTSARRLMSLSSWATSGLSSSPCGCACEDISVPSLMPVQEHVLEVRIVDRDERVLAELLREEPQPDASHRERDTDVGQADRQGARLREVGRHEPDQIHEADGHDEPREAREKQRPPLEIARQQQAERQREVPDHEEQADEAPAVLEPLEIERNLLGQVARPDDQELREREVRPQHHEGEHQLAQIVEVHGLEDVVHRLAAHEQREDRDAER